MIVKYNHPGILVIGYKQSSVRLMPEINEIESSVWDEVKNNPVIVQMLKDKKLEVISLKEEKKAEDGKPVDDSKSTLDGFQYKKAVALVKNTVDRDLLKKWKSHEKRPSVLQAIDEQLGIVEVKPKSLEASVG